MDSGQLQAIMEAAKKLPEIAIKAPEELRDFLTKAMKNFPFLLSTFGTLLFLACYTRHLYPWQVAHYRWAFIASSIFMAIYIGGIIWFSTRPIRKIRFFLKHMGADEKTLLQQYLLENKSCAYFSMKNGAALGLLAKNILMPANRAAMPLWDAPMLLDVYARRFLHKHPSLIGLTKEQIGSKPLSAPEEPFPQLEHESQHP